MIETGMCQQPRRSSGGSPLYAADGSTRGHGARNGFDSCVPRNMAGDDRITKACLTDARRFHVDVPLLYHILSTNTTISILLII